MTDPFSLGIPAGILSRHIRSVNETQMRPLGIRKPWWKSRT